MTLYLVRHARAGSRNSWSGADEERPLSDKGRAQAERIADQFVDTGLKRLISSPAVRCRQTVEPLALRLGITVEDHDALAEGCPTDIGLQLLHELAVEGTDAALCSHGDVIPALMRVLDEGGITGDGLTASAKAGAFVLDTSDGRITRSRYVPPPAVGKGKHKG